MFFKRIVRSVFKYKFEKEIYKAFKECNYTKIEKMIINDYIDIHFSNDFLLRTSAENGCIDLVKLLIEKGANIHADNDYALLYSGDNGHLEVVKYLIEQGADIHAKDDFVLILSIISGKLEIVKYLIEKGIKVNTRGGFGFILSIQYKRYDISRYLIEQGSNIHISDDYLLHCNNEDLIKYAISKDLEYYMNNCRLINKINSKIRNNIKAFILQKYLERT